MTSDPLISPAHTCTARAAGELLKEPHGDDRSRVWPSRPSSWTLSVSILMSTQFVPATGAAQRANEDGEWPHAERKSGGRRAHVVGRDGEERNDLPPKHVPSNRV